MFCTFLLLTIVILYKFKVLQIDYKMGGSGNENEPPPPPPPSAETLGDLNLVSYKKTHKSYSASLPRLMKVDPKLYTMFDAAMQLDSDINGYSLGKLVGKQLEEQDIMNYELVKQWLEDNINDSTKKIRAVTEKEIKCFKKLPALDTTLYKKPDVAIFDEQQQLLVQIEVESNKHKVLAIHIHVPREPGNETTLHSSTW